MALRGRGVANGRKSLGINDGACHRQTMPGRHHSNAEKRWRRGVTWTGLFAVVVETAVVGRRRGHLVAADTVVCCRHGHTFTTLWIPGVSFKALRLGWWRFQYCPVGRHWDLVTPVTVADMTADELEAARQHHDVRLP